jgi:hypothetical protein
VSVAAYDSRASKSSEGFALIQEETGERSALDSEEVLLAAARG